MNENLNQPTYKCYVFAFVLLICCVSNSNSHAQLPPNFWKEVKTIPSAPKLNGNSALMVHPSSQELWVGTLNGEIYKTNDQGISWLLMGSIQDTPITKLLVGPYNFIYAVAGNMVLRSIDDGMSWTRHLPGTPYPITDLELMNDRLIISTAGIVEMDNRVEFVGDGIYVSDDYGITWKKQNTGITFRKAMTHLAVNSYDVAFASMASFDGLGGGLYYSTDAAFSWSRVNTIRYRTTNDTITCTAIYQIHCVEVDAYDTLHVSFEGVSNNVAISGNLKIHVNDLMWNKLWTTERVRLAGFEWDNYPYHSIHFTRHQQHRYSSLHTPNSTLIGGPYFGYAPYGQWTRVPSGMLPVGSGYVKTNFAEDVNGRIYATQVGDYRVFYTDTSCITTTSVPELSCEGIFLVIYPNPTKQHLYVSLQNKVIVKNIQVLNSFGVAVNVPIHDNVIDVSSLSDGIYFVSVKTTKGYATQRFIVSH